MDPILSRRQFLGAAAAASGAALLAQPARAGAADRFGGLPIGVQSFSFRKFSLPETIRHTQGLGLHYVEFCQLHIKPDASHEQLAQLRDTLRGANITMNAFGVQSFGGDHEANRKVFEFAKRAGIRNITANPEAAAFGSLEQLVEEYNIRICIHNHGPGALYDKLESVTRAVQDRHPLLGACVDTGHVLRSGQDPVEWVRTLGPRVFALHIKDVAEKQARTHNVVLGQGHLDVASLFRTLGEIKFPADGCISLEYESNPMNPVDDMKQCLNVAEKAIAQVQG